MMSKRTIVISLLAAGVGSLYSQKTFSTDGQFLEKMQERRAEANDAGSVSSNQDLYSKGEGTSVPGIIGERNYIVYLPKNHTGSSLPLLVVLHGGMGNAQQIQKYIGLEPYADKHGFVIAYMNGSPVLKILSAERAGWNAGECCGQPQEKNIDDVAFISDAVKQITSAFNIDTQRIYGTGHSNGGMMTYRMLCETNVYQGGVIYAGALAMNVDRCPMAAGKPILAIHGAKDENLPSEGGYTKKGVSKRTNHRSQEYTIGVFKNSGANYTHTMLPNAAHKPESINADLLTTENVTLPQKIVSFLQLDR